MLKKIQLREFRNGKENVIFNWNWKMSAITNANVNEHRLRRSYLDWLLERECDCVNVKRGKIWFPVGFEESSENYKRNRFDLRQVVHRCYFLFCFCCCECLNHVDRIVRIKWMRKRAKENIKNKIRRRNMNAKLVKPIILSQWAILCTINTRSSLQQQQIML